MSDPYTPPEAPVRDSAALPKPGGLDRGTYFGAVLLIAVLNRVIDGFLAGQGGAAVVAVVVMGLAFIAVALRLRNIGVSVWWALLFLIPIVNVAIGVSCLALPPNYYFTRELDAIAKVVYGVFALALLGVLAAVLL